MVDLSEGKSWIYKEISNEPREYIHQKMPFVATLFLTSNAARRSKESPWQTRHRQPPPLSSFAFAYNRLSPNKLNHFGLRSYLFNSIITNEPFGKVLPWVHIILRWYSLISILGSKHGSLGFSAEVFLAAGFGTHRPVPGSHTLKNGNGINFNFLKYFPGRCARPYGYIREDNRGIMDILVILSVSLSSLVWESIAYPYTDFRKSKVIHMDIHDFWMSVFNSPYTCRYPH